MTFLWMAAAALLEVGGDAGMRAGLGGRAWGYLLGVGLLAGYGLLVNQPVFGFGRTLGLYIAVFFVVSQTLAWLVWGERPTPGLLVGGALIVAGAAVIHLTGR